MKLRNLLTSLTALGLITVAAASATTHEKIATVPIDKNATNLGTQDFRIDIGSFVTEENSKLNLVGVDTNSTDVQVTKAIIKAVAVLGTDIMHFPVSEALISPHINIILDSNAPHTSAVVAAKDGDLLIKGSAAVTFTLKDANK